MSINIDPFLYKRLILGLAERNNCPTAELDEVGISWMSLHYMAEKLEDAEHFHVHQDDALWQYIRKEHLDPKNKLTDEQWQVFVDSKEYSFSESVSELADTYFREHLAEHGLQELFWDETDLKAVSEELDD